MCLGMQCLFAFRTSPRPGATEAARVENARSAGFVGERDDEKPRRMRQGAFAALCARGVDHVSPSPSLEADLDRPWGAACGRWPERDGPMPARRRLVASGCLGRVRWRLRVLARAGAGERGRVRALASAWRASGVGSGKMRRAWLRTTACAVMASRALQNLVPSAASPHEPQFVHGRGRAAVSRFRSRSCCHVVRNARCGFIRVKPPERVVFRERFGEIWIQYRGTRQRGCPHNTRIAPPFQPWTAQGASVPERAPPEPLATWQATITAYAADPRFRCEDRRTENVGLRRKLGQAARMWRGDGAQCSTFAKGILGVAGGTRSYGVRSLAGDA